MLEIANLEVVYNEVILVLRGLSIEVRDGQIVALLGANGAGKTTVTRAVTGLLDVHEARSPRGPSPSRGGGSTPTIPRPSCVRGSLR